MSKLNILSFISTMFKEKIRNLYYLYLQRNKMEICKVFCIDNMVFFRTDSINGQFPFDEYCLQKIRSQCGENILFTQGIPNPNEKITTIYLDKDITFFQKCVEEFGIEKTFKLIKDWKGQSIYGNGIPIVNYKVLGQ